MKQMSEVKVSICIPTYNNAEHISGTIKSILAQTYKNFELVIVDDNSRDNTVEVIRSFNDERIKLYQNSKNLGMSGNWNRCVELCQGEYIKLICADDILVKDCIETELKEMQKNEGLSMVISDSTLIDDDYKKVGLFPRYPKAGCIQGKKIAKKALIYINYFGMPCAVMFRKDCFQKIGGFDSFYHYILDFDLWVGLASLGDVMVLKKPLNQFRLRRESNTGQVFSTERKVYYAEHRHLVQKYRKELGLNEIQYRISLFSRWLRNYLNSVYLGLVIRGYIERKNADG